MLLLIFDIIRYLNEKVVLFNMKKILLAIAAAIVASIAVFGMSAHAAEIVEKGTCGEGLTWTLDESGILTIIGNGKMDGYASSSGIGWVPSKIPWNDFKKTIKEIVINDGVTSIGEYAFIQLGVQKVTLGKGLVSIDNNAFYECKDLIKIEIPDNVESIGANAFWGCDSLVSVKFPYSIRSIGTAAFQSCKNILEVDIPNGLTNIGKNAFHSCVNLSKLRLPATIEMIGPDAFNGCQRLTDVQYAGDKLMWENVTVGAGNDALKSISFSLTTPSTATLTYNANGGIEPPSPVTVASGSAVTISSEKLSRRNYEFLGWSRTATGAVELVGGNSINLSADTTLYAVWKSTATFATEIILRIDDKAAQVNGATVQNDVAPIIENSRTMLPARFVAEKLGATVAWDDVARKVIITGADGTKIEIIVDSATAYVNGVEHTLDSPAFIRDARTYTPVRFICDNLGANVQWDGVNRIVTITK